MDGVLLGDTLEVLSIRLTLNLLLGAFHPYLFFNSPMRRMVRECDQFGGVAQHAGDGAFGTDAVGGCVSRTNDAVAHLSMSKS